MYVSWEFNSVYLETNNSIKASVHDGTEVPATCNWNQKLSRIGQIIYDISKKILTKYR